MSVWDPHQYLKFADERTQPCRDLAMRVALPSLHRIADLGCGPGNSTAVLAARWAGASVLGVDADAAMIAKASSDYPHIEWRTEDITGWATETGPAFDLVFSNAALQWVGNHETLYPALLSRVARGGALAVQVPENVDAPAQVALRELAAAPDWAADFAGPPVRDWHVQPAQFYFDLLSPLAARLDLWRTEYFHVLETVDALVEWYRGSALRHYLARLTPARQTDFLAAFRARMAEAYPAQANGRVLFPFMRLFLVAYR